MDNGSRIDIWTSTWLLRAQHMAIVETKKIKKKKRERIKERGVDNENSRVRHTGKVVLHSRVLERR